MNKKGEENQLGMIIGTFMIIIIGAILLTASAQQVGETTNTIDVVNDTLSSVNGTTLANLPQLNGKFVSNVVVYNGSDDVIIAAGNYTIFNNQVINGVETALINVSTLANVSILAQDWNISYTNQPTTYISDGGGRAVAGIIIIFFALAILVATLFPTIRNKILEVR